MVVHLEPFYGKGITRIANELKEDGRIKFSSKTLMRHVKNYREDPSTLPDEDDFGNEPPRRKRKSHDIVKEIVIEACKRQAEENRTVYKEPSRSTIATYANLAMLLNPDR